MQDMGYGFDSQRVHTSAGDWAKLGLLVIVCMGAFALGARWEYSRSPASPCDTSTFHAISTEQAGWLTPSAISTPLTNGELQTRDSQFYEHSNLRLECELAN